jgi:hypothetical protein
MTAAYTKQPDQAKAYFATRQSISGKHPRCAPPAVHAWLQMWTTSLFAFADSHLEGLYQSCVAKWARFYAWWYCGVNLLGWISLLVKRVRGDAIVLFLRPPLLAAAIGGLLPSLSVVTLSPFFPAFYRKHWRAINIAINIFQTSSWNYVRQILLWQLLKVQQSPGDAMEGFPVQFLGTTFSVENFFLVSILPRVLAFPTGQATDVLLISYAFLLTTAGSPTLCQSKLWNAIPLRVSLSERYVSRLQTLSTAVSALQGTHVAPVRLASSATPAALTCPAVLGLWGVVGWVLAIFLVFLREIASRRAFLGSHTSLLGSGGPRKAFLWPLGNVAMVHRCVLAFLFPLTVGSFLWSLVLTVFN